MMDILKRNKYVLIITIVVVFAAWFMWGDPLIQQGLSGAGVTNFDRIQLDGTTDPVLDLTGSCIDLDDDGDTSLCADTDDQIDFELGGADQFVMIGVAAADSATTTDAAEIAFTSPIDTTGTNTHNAFTVDLAIGNSTGGTNVVTGVQLDAISGDAQVTETALNIGAGWDSGITNASPATFSSTVGASGIVDLTYVQAADSDAAGDSLEVAFTSPIDTADTNTHNAITVDLAIGNATGGTNNVVGLQIDGITGDAQVTETAINVGTGWANGVVMASDALFSYVQDADSTTTGDAVEIAFTSPIDTTGTQEHNALTVDLSIGNATGGTNTVNAIKIDSISGDAEVTETALNIGSGFVTGVSAPVNQENIGIPTVLSVDIDIDNDSSPFTCATIGASEVWFVHYVYANVLDNFATGGSNDAVFDVGDGGDQDGFLDLDDAELQAADTEGTGAPAGWQGFMSGDTLGAYLVTSQAGFIYDATDTIDCTFGGTGLASDTASVAADITIYIVYTRVE